MNRARRSSLLAFSVFLTAAAAACSGAGEEGVASSDQAVVRYPTAGTCGGLPRVDLGSDATPPGVCIGLVADAKSAPGMRMPRGIVELPTGELIVAAMGSWDPNVGSIWMLTPARAANGTTTYTAKKLLSGVDRPNGLALGPDPLDPTGTRVYVGTPFKIFRFDPKKPDPQTGAPKTRDVIVDLPGDAEKGGHPLRQMVFDGNDVYVNVGSSSNMCKTGGAFPKPCPDEAKDRAGIRHYVLGGAELLPQPIPRADGIGSLPYEMTGRGLRNSMALAIHPTSKVLLQVENARDALGPELPHEEINVIEKGKHYGWPYCHDDNVASPEYKPFDCSGFARPAQLLPAHSAPLGVKYYTGSLFPASYRNKLVIPYHGYDPKGHKLVLVDVDERGIPTGKTPREIIRSWDQSPSHPMGAPVDVFVASDGSILVTEDKNQTVLRVFYDRDGGDGEALAPKGAAPPAGAPQSELALCDEVARSTHSLARIENDVLDTQCAACHSGLINKCDMRGNVERLIAKRKIVPGNAKASELYLRIAGEGDFASRRMPLGGEPVDDELVLAVKTWIDQGAMVP